ncbi:hypothetical protein GCM10017567_73930 [Amycolatopsis bullii]|uniref:Uncharacterized protein n=1 Tax=Amycolatopsis bullii TaxID=941987 RepID=A0ABQ3KPZ8_9PSEU|nr:hypothetical protein GCM10017567_73930 [Amycolatopsis bullii]
MHRRPASAPPDRGSARVPAALVRLPRAVLCASALFVAAVIAGPVIDTPVSAAEAGTGIVLDGNDIKAGNVNGLTFKGSACSARTARASC